MKDLTDAVLYCINMKNRPDRRKLFNSQPALQTLPPIQYVDAIQGSKLNVTNDKRIGLQTRIQVLTQYRRSHYEIHSYGALGASLSHLKAWTEFLKTDSKYALIMEDDADLPTTFSVQVKDCLASLPSSWDILLLGWNYMPRDRHLHQNTSYREVLQFVGAHCYIVSRKAARALVNEALPIETHVEYYMTNTSFIHHLKILRSIHLQIKQMDRVKNRSDVRKPDGCPVCIVDDKEEATTAREETLDTHQKN